VTAEMFLEHVCHADTRKGQVQVCADTPSVRGETAYFIWVIQQNKTVGFCPGVQDPTVR